MGNAHKKVINNSNLYKNKKKRSAIRCVYQSRKSRVITVKKNTDY